MINQNDFGSIMQNLSSNKSFVKQELSSFKYNFLSHLYNICNSNGIDNDINKEKLINYQDISECYITLSYPIYIYLPNKSLIQAINNEDFITSKIFCFIENDDSSKPIMILDFFLKQNGTRFIQILQNHPELRIIENPHFYESDLSKDIVMTFIYHLYNITKEWNNHLTFQNIKYLLKDSSAPTSKIAI